VLADDFIIRRRRNYRLEIYRSSRTTKGDNYSALLELVIRDCKNLSQIKMEYIFPKGRRAITNGIVDQLRYLALQGQLNLERLEMNSLSLLYNNINIESMMSCFAESSLKKPRHFVLVEARSHFNDNICSLVSSAIYNGDHYSTSTVVHLVHQSIIISRGSLEFIASGGIKDLDVLNIFLRVDSTVKKEDVVWKKLKYYCRNSLKKYSIYLKDYRTNRKLFICIG
jgi:hypothetical protein